MPINIPPPNRGENLLNDDGTPTKRAANFFEALSRNLEELPDTLGALTSSAVTQADAATAGATYNQAQAQTVVDLANANKIELNKAITDLETLRTAINGILT